MHPSWSIPKEQLDTKHLKRGVDHIETQKRQIIEPPMHKLQEQSIQMHAHAINHYMINLANKIKTVIHAPTSPHIQQFIMLLHGRHEMFSADYLQPMQVPLWIPKNVTHPHAPPPHKHTHTHTHTALPAPHWGM